MTTEGFSDMLEIAAQTRPELHNLLFEKPPPLVPHYLCYGGWLVKKLTGLAASNYNAGQWRPRPYIGR